MADYTEKEGHWITLSDGRHLFVRDGETVDQAVSRARGAEKEEEADRKDRQIEYNQKEAEELNAEKRKQYDEPIGPGRHMGKVERVFDNSKETLDKAEPNVITPFGEYKVVEHRGAYVTDKPDLNGVGFSSSKDAIKGIWLSHFAQEGLKESQLQALLTAVPQYAKKFGMSEKEALQDCYDFLNFKTPFDISPKFTQRQIIQKFGTLPKVAPKQNVDMGKAPENITKMQYMQQQLAEAKLEEMRKKGASK